MNAKKELLNTLKLIGKTVDDIRAIAIDRLDEQYNFQPFFKKENPTEEDLEILDFEYDNGFGAQELAGLVLFKDNTWLERYEYDGSENWAYKYPPTVNEVMCYKAEED